MSSTTRADSKCACAKDEDICTGKCVLGSVMYYSSKKRLSIVVCAIVVSACVLLLFSTSTSTIKFRFTRESRNVNVESYSVMHKNAKPNTVGMTRQHSEVLPEYLNRYARELLIQVRDSSLASMCTMVMLTYNREDLLLSLLNHYCKVKSLHKILVIWNNVNKGIPNNIIEIRETCATALQFIREKENKLTNRFKPRPEIETECKLSWDRDVHVLHLSIKSVIVYRENFFCRF